MMTTARPFIRGAGLACVLLLGLTACGSSGGGASDGGASPDDVRAALAEGGEITVWAWEPTLEQVVEDFEAEYPNVKVNLVNAGVNTTEYTALQNAISAGSGVPDVVHIEYYALSQFAISDSLTDLTSMGAADLEGAYAPRPWAAVHQGEGIHGLPMDFGPIALYYNQDVFDEHGIEVPTTWQEYVEAGRALHEADPDVYIGADTGDAPLSTSMIWQAGGRPYTVEGTEVTVDFTDAGSTAFAETWQQLVDDDLLAPITAWSDEWYQGLNDGSIATLVMGAWMPPNLESGVPDGAGSWRVAPAPQWEEGANASAEMGGSSLAIPSASDNKELAYAFLDYALAGDGVQTRVDAGAFPAATAILDSEEFLATEFAYFGGQRANEIFAESAANIREDWSWLPYQAYANSIFNDTVGQAYVSHTTFAEGLAAWQAESIEYGGQQGFDVRD